MRNALTAEADSWTSDQTFANNLTGDEPSLTWQTTGLTAAARGKPDVETSLYTEAVSGGVLSTAAPSGTDADGVEIVAYGLDGNCYALYQSNNAGLDFTAYEQFPAAATSPFCDIVATPAGSPQYGAASRNPGTGSATDWYSNL